MEQEAVLLSSAAVASVACAKLGSAIGDVAAVMVGGPNLRGDLEDMKTTLEDIGERLERAEMRSIREKEVQRWLKRLKEAAYDIWDMLDDLQANNTTPPAANTIRTGMLSRLATVPKATNEITNRRDNLRVIQEESPSFSSAIRSSYASEGPRETTPPHIVVEESIITGRDEDKERIVLDVLSATDDIREGPIILPIVGVGGIGKTTLAKLVSDDTRFKDYTKVWISVSGKFDYTKLKMESKDSNHMKFIMERLNEVVGGKKLLVGQLVGKKVLVVLDGLWVNRPELGDLRRMLSPSDGGSKVIVIVTTRNSRTAEGICTLPP